ncbi:hypothetical protein ACFOD0_08245 [Shewanella intestini]|uniref:Carboxypeptidase regulatory-like domain-containing protein n=1 Tax=Shewanella intestini TaxID=2017544 RepID=A0ABS5HYR7_9GAMM|nr:MULTISPECIES: hypothetical protein [Shewanella]MBR9726867.1 hypothetical protein [Shewanella intestini]MRG34567.1 hypothetical protein [Shewanella sp. XMDDZSB0408]
MTKYGWLSLLLSVCMINPCYAHRVKIFAWVNGQAIVGEVYFSGGIKAQQAKISLLDAQQTLAVTTTNRKGEFHFDGLDAKSYQLKANAGPGHQATFSIDAQEFGPVSRATATSSHQLNSSGNSTASTSIPTPTPSSFDSAAVVSLPSLDTLSAVTNADSSAASSTEVNQCQAQTRAAIAQAIIPLRKQLDAFEAEIRFRDIIGGLGYIAGLFGLWSMMRQRRV